MRPGARGLPTLYLDFDGVLHPENVRLRPGPGGGRFIASPEGHLLFEHAELLVSELAPYPAVRIVLSTSWVPMLSFKRAAAQLPAALRSRIIGSTYHSSMGRERFMWQLRGHQVLGDVTRRAPAPWLAIDDNNEGWGAASTEHLVLTDDIHGISAPAVLEDLRIKLRRFG